MEIFQIEVSSLTLVPKTPLFNMVKAGKFKESGEHERLVEMQELIDKIPEDDLKIYRAHNPIM